MHTGGSGTNGYRCRQQNENCFSCSGNASTLKVIPMTMPAILEHGPRRTYLVVIANVALSVLAGFFFLMIGQLAERSRTLPLPSGGGHGIILEHVARQRDVYPVFRTAGVWGTHVIHLNRYFNMQAYSPRDLFVTTAFPVQVPDMASAYEPGLDSHSWLFIAARTGLVRKVTTVLPEKVFAPLLMNRENRVFTYANGSFRGFMHDIPRTITRLDSLPSIAEPVIVNVDAAYFAGGEDPFRTAALLQERCRHIRMLVLIRSEDEPLVTDEMRRRLSLFATAWQSSQ